MKVSLAACSATLGERIQHDERDGYQGYVDIVCGRYCSYKSEDDLNDHSPRLATSGEASEENEELVDPGQLDRTY